MAFTSSPSMATPPDCDPDPFIDVSTHSNQNINPDDDHKSAFRTPLTSPTKPSAPTTQQPTKSTPLYRRFLKEVTMSPATPPQSPSPTKSRASPNMRSDSPAKGANSPMKYKLEVGHNGFHFSYELPKSKIVPKKVVKDASTPTRRTHSPTRMGSARVDAVSRDVSPVKGTPSKRTSPAKQTPSKEPSTSPAVTDFAPVKSSATRNGLPRKSAPTLSRTPRPQATTPTPDKHTKSAGTSSAKFIKMATEFVEGSSTPRQCPKDGQVVMKEEGAIGDQVVPATLASTNSPRPPLNATGNTPTRAKRGASFDIGDMMVGLKAHASKPRAEVVERVGETNIPEPPTPLRKAAEKLQHIVRIKELRAKPKSPPQETSNEITPIVLAEPVTITHIVSPFKIKEQTWQYRPVRFLPPNLEPSPDAGECSPSKEHVKFNDGRDVHVSKPCRPAIPRTPSRNGTDPDVKTAIRKEMSSLEQSLSHSLGVNFRFSKGKENTFELPTMANSVQLPDFGTPATTRPKRALLRTTSDVSSTSNSTTASSVRASVFMHPKRSPTKPPTPSSRVPKWPYAGKTPAQARRERLAAAKDEDDVDQSQINGSHPDVPMKAASIKLASTLDSSKMKAKGSTPRTKGAGCGTSARSRATPAPVGTQSTPCANEPAAVTSSRLGGTSGSAAMRMNPTATPAKPNSGRGGIPQSARKFIFDSPASNRSAPTPKFQIKTPDPTTARKPPAPTLGPQGTPLPKFATATAIADRVAEWNSEDRQKAAMSLPQKSDEDEPTLSKRKKNGVNSPKGTPSKNEKDKESHTPEGSPTKLHLRSPTKPSRLLPPKVKTKVATPKRMAPKAPATPKVQKNAFARLRGPTPHTPASCALDPNAYRTPSKEIESSLDQAIDRKIEQDAKSGKEYTPSGNRVKTLLEARRWE